MPTPTFHRIGLWGRHPRRVGINIGNRKLDMSHLRSGIRPVFPFQFIIPDHLIRQTTNSRNTIRSGNVFIVFCNYPRILFSNQSFARSDTRKKRPEIIPTVMFFRTANRIEGGNGYLTLNGNRSFRTLYIASHRNGIPFPEPSPEVETYGYPHRPLLLHTRTSEEAADLNPPAGKG